MFLSFLHLPIDGTILTSTYWENITENKYQMELFTKDISNMDPQITPVLPSALMCM